LGARGLGSQVALQTNTVDLDAPGLDQLHDAERALVLGLAVLEVVVVVVELGGWVGGCGHAEGDGEVLFADHAEEDVVAVGAVFVECFLCLLVFGFVGQLANVRTLVDNVPVRALSLVSAHYSVDVVLHHAHQRRVIVDLVYPSRQLRIPYKSMASHLLVVLRGKVGNLVGATEAELSAVWLGGIPLHSILRCDGTELGTLDEVLFSVVVADGQ
jgi:hypothetical protein